MKACCIGCSSPPSRQAFDGGDRPALRRSTARVRQDSTRRPSTSTVQAPHWPWSQPFLVPVGPDVRASASSKRGARVERQRMLAAVDLQRQVDGRRRVLRRGHTCRRSGGARAVIGMTAAPAAAMKLRRSNPELVLESDMKDGLRRGLTRTAHTCAFAVINKANCVLFQNVRIGTP